MVIIRAFAGHADVGTEVSFAVEEALTLPCMIRAEDAWDTSNVVLTETLEFPIRTYINPVPTGDTMAVSFHSGLVLADTVCTPSTPSVFTMEDKVTTFDGNDVPSVPLTASTFADIEPSVIDTAGRSVGDVR